MNATHYRDLEVVRLRPKDGARDELLALRPTLIDQYQGHFPDRFDATLTESEDGEWVDIWRWVSREDAECALANRDLIPAFDRWEELVDLHSVDWTTIIG